MCTMGVSSGREIAKELFQANIGVICDILNFYMTVMNSYK